MVLPQLAIGGEDALAEEDVKHVSKLDSFLPGRSPRLRALPQESTHLKVAERSCKHMLDVGRVDCDSGLAACRVWL